MRNLTIFLIIAAATAVGIYLWNDEDSPPVFTDQSGVITGIFSIRDIMELNKSLSCSFRKNEQGSSVVGAIIMFEDMIRGDFDIDAEVLEAPIASHFIVKGDTVYTWTSLANVGYKSGVVEHSSGGSPVEQAAVVGLEDRVEYTCTPWNADLTRFNLPSGITFQEIQD